MNPGESYPEFRQRQTQEPEEPAEQPIGTDLDNLPQQKHNWVRRGLKISCEGALHPHHSHFLVTRRR